MELMQDLSPNSVVPKSGVYYCKTCFGAYGLRSFLGATGYEKREPTLIERYAENLSKGINSNSNEPMVIKRRFRSGEKFDVCPRHGDLTHWAIETADPASRNPFRWLTRKLLRIRP